MHAWIRPPQPPELTVSCVALTGKFKEEHQRTGKTPACDWPRVRDSEGREETLQSHLARHTAHHCNYCDSLMGYSSRNTIDHFLPKSLFHDQAYEWSNLYLCCDGCQRKGTNYDFQALRPDEEGYSFHRYFRYRLDGSICVIAIEEADKARAEITVKVFKLDHRDLTSDRLKEFNLKLKRRSRPLPPGLDSHTALSRMQCLQPSFEHRPYRDYYSQSTD